MAAQRETNGGATQNHQFVNAKPLTIESKFVALSLMIHRSSAPSPPQFRHSLYIKDVYASRLHQVVLPTLRCI